MSLRLEFISAENCSIFGANYGLRTTSEVYRISGWSGSALQG